MTQWLTALTAAGVALIVTFLTVGAWRQVRHDLRTRRRVRRLGLGYDRRPGEFPDVEVFEFLRRGRRRRIRYLISGRLDDEPLRVFTYTYLGDERDSRERTAASFQCAIVTLPVSRPIPALQIERLHPSLWHAHDEVRRLSSGPAPSSQTFERACAIRCRDQVVADAVLGQAAREWLLAGTHPLVIEIADDALLCAIPLVDDAWPDGDVVRAHHLAVAFRRRIPPDVLDPPPGSPLLRRRPA